MILPSSCKFFEFEVAVANEYSRYLVHCLGRYYDLDTWSVTKPDPARREAYVGIKGMPIAAPVQSRALLQPLWAMV
jgi:hypothetical protein